MTNISRSDRSLEEYTREFLKLSRYAKDMIRDQYITVTTYVTSLGSIFAGIPTTGLSLEAMTELAKEIKLRLIRQGVMPNFYQIGGTRAGGY